jgi:hypothetical protein
MWECAQRQTARGEAAEIDEEECRRMRRWHYGLQPVGVLRSGPLFSLMLRVLERMRYHLGWS